MISQTKIWYLGFWHQENLPRDKIKNLLDSIHLSYKWGQSNMDEIINFAAENQSERKPSHSIMQVCLILQE